MDHVSIISNAFVITCNAQDQGGRMSLLIEDGRISDIAGDSDLFREVYPEATVIDGRQLLVVPGFVNAHYHPESLLFQDISSQKPFALWKSDKRFRERVARILDPEFQDDLLVVHTLAAIHHLRSGVTTVCQAVPGVPAQELDAIQRTVHDSGVRTLGVIRTWEQIAEARRMQDNGRLAISLGSEDELTVYSFDNITRAAREAGLRLSAHFGERKEDAEIIRRNFRKGMLPLLRDFGVLGPALHLVHLNHAAAADVRLAAEHDATITLCPRSAGVKRTGYPLLRHLNGSPVRLSLGTDWGETDMLQEMAFMQQLSFLFSGLPSFTPVELLRMATINGAIGLGLGAEVGSIERGKRADLVFFTLAPVHLQHLTDTPGAQELARVLLEDLHQSDIVRVMVEGVTLFEDRRCTQIDEESIVSRFRRIYASMPGAFEQPAAPSAKARIIPFVAPASSRASELEGFEEGFVVVRQPEAASAQLPGPRSMTQDPAPPAEPEPQPPAPPQPAPVQTKPRLVNPPKERVVQKPELSKNVRRVFGEDDDPTGE